MRRLDGTRAEFVVVATELALLGRDLMERDLLSSLGVFSGEMGLLVNPFWVDVAAETGLGFISSDPDSVEECVLPFDIGCPKQFSSAVASELDRMLSCIAHFICSSSLSCCG